MGFPTCSDFRDWDSLCSLASLRWPSVIRAMRCDASLISTGRIPCIPIRRRDEQRNEHERGLWPMLTSSAHNKWTIDKRVFGQ